MAGMEEMGSLDRQEKMEETDLQAHLDSLDLLEPLEPLDLPGRKDHLAPPELQDCQGRMAEMVGTVLQGLSVFREEMERLVQLGKMEEMVHRAFKEEMDEMA